MNPYNWQSHRPQITVQRPDVEVVAEKLLGNGSAVVLGGRGMGKSVFLGQLQARLSQEPDTAVVLIDSPSAQLTIEGCFQRLAKGLSVVADPTMEAREILEAYFSQQDAPQRLVLLFDEFDRYAEKGEPSAQPPGRGFFNDLEAARRSMPQLGLMAAGSIGVFIFRDVLGSSFMSRAFHLRLHPFNRDEAASLMTPFEEHRKPLQEEVRDALFLASGGIPALITYGLQEIWKLDDTAVVTADLVTEIYKRFEAHHDDYLRDLLSSVTDPRFSDAPFRVWQYIQENAGRMYRADLEEALGKPSGSLQLNLVDCLRFLEAVGLIRVQGSPNFDNPITAFPIPSVLNLSRSTTIKDDVRLDFFRDLTSLLAKLHRSSADFFRPGRQAQGKQLVPESVFAAHLSLGFELLGWKTEREAQRGAGRTDLVLRRNGDKEVAILEVKIWGHNDFKEAQQQVESYWSDDVVAAAVVQLTDRDVKNWASRYQAEALTSSTTEEIPVAKTALQARFSVSSSAAGFNVRVDHFLVALPRR